MSGTFTGKFNGTPGVFVGTLDIPIEPLIGEIKQRINKIGREELADYLGVSLSVVDRLRRTGKIPYLKAGGCVVFDRAKVDEALGRRVKT